MSGVKPLGGFTIVEVLIVLAITGGLFLIAMVAINGQAQKAEFTQGLRDFHSRIDSVINDVSDGAFPDAAGFACTPNIGSTPTFDSPGAGGGQGTNKGCIFLGKVIAFSSSPDELNKFKVFTVAGARLNSSDHEVTNFADAQPVAADISSPNNKANLTDTQIMPFGLQVTMLESIKDGVKTDIEAFGIINSFGSYESIINHVSGPDKLVVAPVPTSLLSSGYNPADVKNLKSVLSLDLNPEAIIMCIQQGAGGQQAAIIVGSQGHQAGTQLYIGQPNITAALSKISGSVACPVL